MIDTRRERRRFLFYIRLCFLIAVWGLFYLVILNNPQTDSPIPIISSKVYEIVRLVNIFHLDIVTSVFISYRLYGVV